MAWMKTTVKGVKDGYNKILKKKKLLLDKHPWRNNSKEVGKCVNNQVVKDRDRVIRNSPIHIFRLLRHAAVPELRKTLQVVFQP